MRVMLKISTTEAYRQLAQLRWVLSWGALYLFGGAVTLLLVYAITGAFGR